MGTARGGGVVGAAAPTSNNEKVKELASSLLKLASSAMAGLKAVFSKVVVNDDKAIANPPGMKPVELPNKPVEQLKNEGATLKDLLKSFGMFALAASGTRNPIALFMLNEHARNYEARAKAKEAELKKQAKAAEKAAKAAAKGSRAAKAKVQKTEAAIKQVKILERKMEVMRKQNTVLIERVAKLGGRTITAADRQSAKEITSAFVKLGFSPQNAQKAVSTTLTRISPSEAERFMKEALKEVSVLKKS